MTALFYCFSALAVLGALVVVVFKHPLHCAMGLLASLLGVALLFFLQGAEFLGAVQILVYAGGVLVLFLFGIMFVSPKNIQEKIFRPFWPAAWLVGLLVFFLMVTHLKLILAKPTKTLPQTVYHMGGHTEALGQILYTQYLIPFEVASVFLLVAMVGAILLGRYGVKR